MRHAWNGRDISSLDVVHASRFRREISRVDPSFFFLFNTCNACRFARAKKKKEKIKVTLRLMLLSPFVFLKYQRYYRGVRQCAIKRKLFKDPIFPSDNVLHRIINPPATDNFLFFFRTENGEFIARRTNTLFGIARGSRVKIQTPFDTAVFPPRQHPPARTCNYTLFEVLIVSFNFKHVARPVITRNLLEKQEPRGSFKHQFHFRSAISFALHYRAIKCASVFPSQNVFSVVRN